MKRLCLIIPALHPGGMERVMSELICYFSKIKELEVHLILYGRKREIFYYLPDNIIIHKPDFLFDSSIRSSSLIKTLWFLRTKVKEINPDSILSFGEYVNSFVLIALLNLEYPVYISDRGQPNKNLGAFQNILRGILYRRSSGLIPQTIIAKNIYKTKFKNLKIEVIGNPVKRNNKPSGINYKENIVLSVGRLIPTKNFDKLIEMFVRINQPGWKLIIVGGDALKLNLAASLKDLIKSLNAEDRIQLVGNQSNVNEYYYKSKIFAFTSSSEGFPNVIGEAQSAGLPVIAFDCVAGPSEMISDEVNGYLIPLFDYFNFEKKLKELMENEDIRIKFEKKAGLNIEKYTIEIVGHKYLSFII